MGTQKNVMFWHFARQSDAFVLMVVGDSTGAVSRIERVWSAAMEGWARPVSSVFAFPVRALTPAPVVFMVEVQQKRRCVAHAEARPCSKPEVLSPHLQMRCPTDLCHDRGPMGPGFWGLEQALSPSVRKTLRGRAQAVNMRIGVGSAHSNQLTPRKIQKTNNNTKKNQIQEAEKAKEIN